MTYIALRQKGSLSLKRPDASEDFAKQNPVSFEEGKEVLVI